jgi:hypothetical protein
MRREERKGGRDQPFCGPGASAIAGGPEGEAPKCKQEADAKPSEETTGALATATGDVPPPPEAKPEGGPVEPAAKPAPKKTTSSSKSAKRAFKREVGRLRRFFSD